MGARKEPKISEIIVCHQCSAFARSTVMVSFKEVRLLLQLPNLRSEKKLVEAFPEEN